MSVFDYSPCDLCPYDVEYSTYHGNVCEDCKARRAEQQLISRLSETEGLE